MTKKDYIIIAKALKDAHTFLETETETILFEKIVFNLSNELSKQNPHFDFDKFAFACGIKES